MWPEKVNSIATVEAEIAQMREAFGTRTRDLPVAATRWSERPDQRVPIRPPERPLRAPEPARFPRAPFAVRYHGRNAAMMARAVAAMMGSTLLRALGRDRSGGTPGRLAAMSLLLVGGAVAWIVFDGIAKHDLTSERLALDARASELTMRALAPGSTLACLSAAAGNVVEASCQKSLFTTPEITATAVAFVSAQLILLANATDFARRDSRYEPTAARLRRWAESDSYGLVSHVLAARDGCTVQRCDAFAMLQDSTRVKANLAAQPYDAQVARYAADWPEAAAILARLPGPAPVAVAPAAALAREPGPAAIPTPSSVAITASASAAASGPAPAAGTVASIRMPGPDVFFPSSDSIPPVNIMNAEPAGPPEPAAAASPSKTSSAQRKAPAKSPSHGSTEGSRPATSGAATR